MTQNTNDAIPELTEEQLRALKNDSTHFLHAWIRDIASNNHQTHSKLAMELVESFITSATGAAAPQVNTVTVGRHANF